jgi:dihydroorotate dehydrogenase
MTEQAPATATETAPKRTAGDMAIAVFNRGIYPLLRRILFLVAPERIHHVVFSAFRFLGRFRILRSVAGRLFAVNDPVLRTTAFGVEFPAPLGLAAGFDKNGEGIDAWGALGFGYAEIGTVTASAQPGNPQPRMFRLAADRALINRMGFNNHGAGEAAGRLRIRKATGTAVPIGANIGKTKIVEPQDAADDYRASARLLGPLADFVVVNVSSPNTPGLRDLQAVDSLRPILAAVLAAVDDKPVLVKIAPDLADNDVDAVADLAVELGLAGIVCTNTTIRRDGLKSDPAVTAEVGGLSGPPVAERSLEVLRRLHSRVGDRLTLVSVGGIETADQAWERICAGATLLQGYTGFIYGGPFWTTEIHRGLAARVRAAGFATIADAVGSATPR